MSQNSSYTHTSLRTTVSWLCAILYTGSNKTKNMTDIFIFSIRYFSFFTLIVLNLTKTYSSTPWTLHILKGNQPFCLVCVCVCVCAHACLSICVCVCAQSQIFWLVFYCIPLTLSSDLYVSSSRSRHVRSCFSISSRRSLVVCSELKAFWSFSIRPIWASFFLTCEKADKRSFNYDMILCFDLWASVYHTCINREGS